MKNPNEAPLEIAGIAWRDIQKGELIEYQKVLEMYSILFDKKEITIMPASAEPFQTLKVKAWLEDMRDLINKPLVIKQESGNLRILTDAEAVEYLNKKANSKQRQHKKITRKLFRNVDEANLSKYQRDELRGHQSRHAFIAASAEGARKQALQGGMMPKLTPPDE